jgi:hypothetical protein
MVNKGRSCRSKAYAGRMRSVTGRHGCRTVELPSLGCEWRPGSGHGGLRTVLSWPRLIWGLCLIQHLVSSRPREPIEKRWMRTP